jgi:hypothetical protein
MNDSGISSKPTIRGGLRLVFVLLSMGIGVAIGIFGVYLGVIGIMSAGTYGVHGMSDVVASLMEWSLPVVCLVLLGGLALGIIGATWGQERGMGAGCALAVVLLCTVGGGLVYLLGWFLFLSGKAFHF